MGNLKCGERSIWIDDRFLAHLERVTFAALKRGDSFTITWAVGGILQTVSVGPRDAISFTYATWDDEPLDPLWLAALSDSAASEFGMVIDAGHAA